MTAITKHCEHAYRCCCHQRGMIHAMLTSPKSWQSFKIGDKVRALDHAPADYRGRAGVILGSGHGNFDFLVEFPERSPEFGYMRREWLVPLSCVRVKSA